MKSFAVVVVVAIAASDGVQGVAAASKRPGAVSISAEENPQSPEDFVKEMQKAENLEELTKVLKDKSPEERKPIIEYLLPSKFSACATNDSDGTGELFVFDFDDLNKYEEANLVDSWPVRAKKSKNSGHQRSSGNDSTPGEDDVLFMHPKHLIFVGSVVDLLINGFPMPCHVLALPSSSNNNSYTLRTYRGETIENVNPKDVSKMNPLHHPIRAFTAPVVFDADDRINKLDASKRSILHYAAKAGMHDLIAQMFAVQKEYYKAGQIYKAEGIQTNGVDADGKTPIEHALPYPETVKALAGNVTHDQQFNVMVACVVNDYRESFNTFLSVFEPRANPDQAWHSVKSYVRVRALQTRKTQLQDSLYGGLRISDKYDRKRVERELRHVDEQLQSLGGR